MRYTRKWLGIGVTLGALALATATQASADVKTVRISGTERFKPNEEVVNTFRFTPGHLTVKSGETVTWTHNESPADDHTITIVDKKHLPKSFAYVDKLFVPSDPNYCQKCVDAMNAHMGGAPVVNVGPAGLDEEGDSLFIGGTQANVSDQVTAPAGTTLYYLCLIHPWMQGSINVH